MTPHLHSSMFEQKPRLMTTSAIRQAHMLHLSYPPTHIKEKMHLHKLFFPFAHPSLHLMKWLFIRHYLSYPAWNKDLLGFPGAFVLMFHIFFFLVLKKSINYGMLEFDLLLCKGHAE